MASRATPTAGKTSTSVKSTKASHSQQAPLVPHEKIAMRAYEKWCGRGCPEGSECQDWLEAETELRSEMTTAGKRTAKQTRQQTR